MPKDPKTDPDPDTAAMLAGAEVEHGGDEQVGVHRPRTHPPDLPPINAHADSPRDQHGSIAHNDGDPDTSAE